MSVSALLVSSSYRIPGIAVNQEERDKVLQNQVADLRHPARISQISSPPQHQPQHLMRTLQANGATAQRECYMACVTLVVAHMLGASAILATTTPGVFQLACPGMASVVPSTVPSVVKQITTHGCDS
jgi:hypothetical protein